MVIPALRESFTTSQNSTWEPRYLNLGYFYCTPESETGKSLLHSHSLRLKISKFRIINASFERTIFHHNVWRPTFSNGDSDSTLAGMLFRNQRETCKPILQVSICSSNPNQDTRSTSALSGWCVVDALYGYHTVWLNLHLRWTEGLSNWTIYHEVERMLWMHNITH